MSYRFEPGEAVSDGVRRIVDEVLRGALDALATGTDDGIHDARTGVKRARALLRMLRPALGSSAFAAEDARLGDATRGLSAARDAYVLLDALKGLRARRPEALDAETFEAARSLLVGRRHAGDELDRARAAAADGIEAARGAARDWPIGAMTWPTLRRGLVDVYRSARSRFRVAYDEPADERFHDLRKRVKALGYAADLLRPVWPAMMKLEHEALKELGDRLGDDRDLGALDAALVASSELDERVRAELASLIEGRRAELRVEAHGLAARVLAERPKAFGRRVDAYWDAWRRESLEPSRRSSVVGVPRTTRPTR